jgi:hypothetical protein
MTLPAPGGLGGIAGNRQISLSWLGVSGAAAYNLSSSASPGGPFAPIANALAATNFVDTNAVAGQTNYYQVAAVNACHTGVASTPIGVFLPKPELSIASSGDSITVSWPDWAADWNVYYTTNLAPPITWALVTNGVINSNGSFSVTLPVSDDAGFFQLVAP